MSGNGEVSVFCITSYKMSNMHLNIKIVGTNIAYSYDSISTDKWDNNTETYQSKNIPTITLPICSIMFGYHLCVDFVGRKSLSLLFFSSFIIGFKFLFQ